MCVCVCMEIYEVSIPKDVLNPLTSVQTSLTCFVSSWDTNPPPISHSIHPSLIQGVSSPDPKPPPDHTPLPHLVGLQSRPQPTPYNPVHTPGLSSAQTPSHPPDHTPLPHLVGLQFLSPVSPLLQVLNGLQLLPQLG